MKTLLLYIVRTLLLRFGLRPAVMTFGVIILVTGVILSQDFSSSRFLDSKQDISDKKIISPVDFKAEAYVDNKQLTVSLKLDITEGGEVYFDGRYFFKIFESSKGLKHLTKIYPDFLKKDLISAMLQHPLTTSQDEGKSVPRHKQAGQA